MRHGLKKAIEIRFKQRFVFLTRYRTSLRRCCGKEMLALDRITGKSCCSRQSFKRIAEIERLKFVAIRQTYICISAGLGRVAEKGLYSGRLPLAHGAALVIIVWPLGPVK